MYAIKRVALERKASERAGERFEALREREVEPQRLRVGEALLVPIESVLEGLELLGIMKANRLVEADVLTIVLTLLTVEEIEVAHERGIRHVLLRRPHRANEVGLEIGQQEREPDVAERLFGLTVDDDGIEAGGKVEVESTDGDPFLVRRLHDEMLTALLRATKAGGVHHHPRPPLQFSLTGKSSVALANSTSGSEANMIRTAVFRSFLSSAALLSLASVSLFACDKKEQSTASTSTSAAKPSKAEGPPCPALKKDGWDRGPEGNFGGNGCSDAKLGKFTCTVHGDLEKWKTSTEGKACKPLVNSNFWCCDQ
jgi:hypothetical protein